MPNARRLGSIERVTLQVLRSSKKGLTGIDLQAKVVAKVGRDVTLGSVYSAAKRLESDGLVQVEMTPSRPMRGGKPRRKLILTERGRAALG